jgi:hypothetical protein
MTKAEKTRIEEKMELEIEKAKYWNILFSDAKKKPLTAEQLEEAQEKMAKRIWAIANAEKLSTSKLMPITDGVSNIDAYFSSKPKIMWILKEPYDDFSNDGKPKGGGYSISDAIKDLDIKRIGQTWKRIAEITHNILTDEHIRAKDLPEKQIREELSRIAYINVSKMPAFKQTSEAELAEKFKIWKETLLMQIELYSPDVIIFGHTFNLFDKADLGITEDYEYQDDDSWLNVYRKNDKKKSILIVDTYHPANRAAWEYFDYPTAVVDAVRKLWKNE